MGAIDAHSGSDTAARNDKDLSGNDLCGCGSAQQCAKPRRFTSSRNAAHHRASPCHFGIALAFDNTHKPLMLNPRGGNRMEANLLEANAATGNTPADRHQPKLAHRQWQIDTGR
jgi:hypothetical protein